MESIVLDLTENNISIRHKHTLKKITKEKESFQTFLHQFIPSLQTFQNHHT